MRLFTGTQLHRFSSDEEGATAHFTHEGEERTASAQLVFQAWGGGRTSTAWGWRRPGSRPAAP